MDTEEQEELEGGNECFCKCHRTGKLICPKCRIFHNGEEDGE